MITSVEIRNHTFKRSLRGYDMGEVRAFLQILSEEWEQHLQDRGRLMEELHQLRADNESLKGMQNALQKTLMHAEESASATMENARQKAELKIQEAELQTRELLQRSIDKREQAERDIAELTARKDEIVMQLELFLKAQLDRIKSFERKQLPARIEEGAEATPPQDTPPPPPPPVAESPEQEASHESKPNERDLLFSEQGQDQSLFDDLADKL